MPVVARAGGLLPWEAIELVSRSRWWAFEKMIKIRPRDPDIRRQLGPTSTFDATIGWWYIGPPLSAMLSFTDRSESAVMAAIAQYSAGRFPIHQPDPSPPAIQPRAAGDLGHSTCAHSAGRQSCTCHSAERPDLPMCAHSIMEVPVGRTADGSQAAIGSGPCNNVAD